MKYAATRALYHYWDRLRAGRAAPERGDLEPGVIRTILGDVFMLESTPGADHMVRLAGTRICTLLGREWRGRPFSEPFVPDGWSDIRALLDGVSATSVPAVFGLRGETQDGRQLDLEMLLLPLRHRGKTHARLLGSLTCEDWPYWAGAVPVVRFRLVSVRHLTSDAAPAANTHPVAAAARMPLGRLRLVPGGKA